MRLDFSPKPEYVSHLKSMLTGDILKYADIHKFASSTYAAIDSQINNYPGIKETDIFPDSSDQEKDHAAKLIADAASSVELADEHRKIISEMCKIKYIRYKDEIDHGIDYILSDMKNTLLTPEDVKDVIPGF